MPTKEEAKKRAIEYKKEVENIYSDHGPYHKDAFGYTKPALKDGKDATDEMRRQYYRRLINEFPTALFRFYNEVKDKFTREELEEMFPFYKSYEDHIKILGHAEDYETDAYSELGYDPKGVDVKKKEPDRLVFPAKAKMQGVDTGEQITPQKLFSFDPPKSKYETGEQIKYQGETKYSK